MKINICRDAALAIKCAKGYREWGADAARRFAVKHVIHPSLIRLARMCDTSERMMQKHRCIP